MSVQRTGPSLQTLGKRAERQASLTIGVEQLDRSSDDALALLIALFDPMVGATPPVHGGLVQQMHDTIVWQEGGYYLALYQYQHDGIFLDLRLAVSRDGENFTFIHPELPFLPSGQAGDGDRMQGSRRPRR